MPIRESFVEHFFLFCARVTFTLAQQWRSSAYLWRTAIDMATVAGSAFSPETHTVGGTWLKSGVWQFHQITMLLLGMIILSFYLKLYQTSLFGECTIIIIIILFIQWTPTES